MKKYTKWIVFGILMVTFAFCVVCAVSGCSVETELKIAHAINPNGNHNPVMRFFTEIGEVYGVLAVIAVLFLIPLTRKNVAFPAAIITLVAFACNQVLKTVVCRARPTERLLEIEGFSFPSGHTINSTALYVAVMLLLLPLCKTRIQRILTITVCTGLSFLIGFSRIYFNVHYSTDVLCGWCLGTAVALLGVSVYHDWKGMKNHGADDGTAG